MQTLRTAAVKTADQIRQGTMNELNCGGTRLGDGVEQNAAAEGGRRSVVAKLVGSRGKTTRRRRKEEGEASWLRVPEQRRWERSGSGQGTRSAASPSVAAAPAASSRPWRVAAALALWVL